MDNYVLNDKGEKVIVGSRRPDGTLRKERRIRAGYTPQDEQPAYVSVGTQFKVGGPKCPGYDPSADDGSSSAAKSKAAKKNEKRKAKKAEGHKDEDDAAAAPSVSAAAPAAPRPAPAAPAASSSGSAPPAAAGGGSDAAAAAAAGALSRPAAAVDKQIKALSKKVRQCQALVAREQGGGEALSSQEREKVDKMPGWEKEIEDLQKMLAKLLQ